MYKIKKGIDMIIYKTEVGGQNDEEPPDTKNQ